MNKSNREKVELILVILLGDINPIQREVVNRNWTEGCLPVIAGITPKLLDVICHPPKEAHRTFITWSIVGVEKLKPFSLQVKKYRNPMTNTTHVSRNFRWVKSRENNLTQDKHTIIKTDINIKSTKKTIKIERITVETNIETSTKYCLHNHAHPCYLDQSLWNTSSHGNQIALCKSCPKIMQITTK